VKPHTKFVHVLANGFVGVYYWSLHRHGLSTGRTVLYCFVSLIAINIALILGQMLGERSTRNARRK